MTASKPSSKRNAQLRKRRAGKLDLEMTVRDGKVTIVAKEGDLKLLDVKDGAFKNLNEILEMLNRKL